MSGDFYYIYGLQHDLKIVQSHETSHSPHDKFIFYNEHLGQLGMLSISIKTFRLSFVSFLFDHDWDLP